MRINSYIAKATGISRRAADTRIENGAVRINDTLAKLGQTVSSGDTVQLDGNIITIKEQSHLIALHKPVGYVCSRQGQGSKTIYDLLPKNLHHLKPAGRLDKASSGLLLLTDDGSLAHQLTHPSFHKQKVYRVHIDQPLQPTEKKRIATSGVDIGDTRPSSFELKQLDKAGQMWLATLQEGRNRQIRRTFSALGHRVSRLHRISFGPYQLGGIALGSYKQLKK